MLSTNTGSTTWFNAVLAEFAEKSGKDQVKVRFPKSVSVITSSTKNFLQRFGEALCEYESSADDLWGEKVVNVKSCVRPRCRADDNDDWNPEKGS